jgi:hypothetical protein
MLRLGTQLGNRRLTTVTRGFSLVSLWTYLGLVKRWRRLKGTRNLNDFYALLVLTICPERLYHVLIS